MNEVHRRIIEGTKEAAKSAVDKAKRHGTNLVVWREGKAVEVSPHEINV